jgi:hypothetical protein
VSIVKNVEAWQLVQLHSRIKNRVRLPTKNFNMMTQIKKSLGEVSRVHTLATYMGLAAIRQIGNAQGAVGVERR